MPNTVLLAFLFTLTCCFSPAAYCFDLLIKDVKVVNKDGQISNPIQVRIDDGVIAEIAPTLAHSSLTKHKVIDAMGHYLIPGLIDSHVHLAGVPGESKSMPTDIRQAALEQIPRSYLYFGFTTLLDLISDDAQINEWNQQAIAPTAYHCVGVPIPGGYPLAWQPLESQLSHPAAAFYLFDPRQKLLMQQTAGSQNHKTHPLIRLIANTQAKCIKAFYEKGFGPLKNLPVPSVPMMQELVTEAHNQGLPVYVHGNSVESHEFALLTGADLLVHGAWHLSDSKQRQNPAEQIAQLAKATAEKGVGVQPTIQVIYGEREMLNPQFFDQPLLKQAMPSSLLEWYQTKTGQWFAHQLATNFGDVPKLRRYQHAKKAFGAALGNVQTHLRELQLANAKLYFGSDTPSGPLYTQFPGFNGREEINRWAEQGIPLLDVFKSLTIENAKLLSLEHTIGSIEVGKTADLLILKKNPLETVAAYDSIKWVVLGGKALNRENLAAN